MKEKGEAKRGDDLRAFEAWAGKAQSLLVGLTGGIASGKTTVANMLAEQGAYTIDYDLLAREVVEPGKPAWKEIVDYFGRKVLLENHTLDRKALGRIVFRDMEKRRMLESFIHPRTHEACAREVMEIKARDPEAVIQVVTPLLFEVRLQHRFHRSLLVHIPREMQVERLMKRDRITREAAEDILNAQMPIDEKVKLADFVIRNEGSLLETRRQVEEVWRKLKEVQGARHRREEPGDRRQEAGDKGQRTKDEGQEAALREAE